MDEVFSKFTDHFNCESSDRMEEQFLQQPIHSLRRQEKDEIELRFRRSNQTYIFPRKPFISSDSDSSIQSVVDLNCNIKRTIESPHRLKTEGNEKSEDQLDMNFNFNSSSEHLSEDVAVLHPRPYKQKLKPPITKKPTYKAILNDLERRLQTMNKQGRVKSSSGSVSTTYNTKKPLARQATPQQHHSKIQKNNFQESKKSLQSQNCQDYLLSILQKNKSKSHERGTAPIFNVHNSNINLNVNINSQTIDVGRKQAKRPKELTDQTIAVAQILKKNKVMTINRSVGSSQQQRYSNRCSTEPLDEISLWQKFKKKQPTRCSTGMENSQQTTQQYLTQMKKQQSTGPQTNPQLSLKIKQRSNKSSVSKYKKNLRIE